MISVSELLAPAIEFLSKITPEERCVFLVLLETANRCRHNQSLPGMEFFLKANDLEYYRNARTGALFLLAETLEKYPGGSIDVIKNRLFDSVGKTEEPELTF